jgi:TolA-binding protein
MCRHTIDALKLLSSGNTKDVGVVNFDNEKTTKVFMAVSQDVQQIDDRLQEVQTEIKNIHNTINSNQNIINQTNTTLLNLEEKITLLFNEKDNNEEKSQIIPIFMKNKWFWIITVLLVVLSGIGISHLLEHSNNVVQLTSATANLVK